MGATKPNGEAAADAPTGDNGDSGGDDDDAPCHRCGATWWEPGNEMLLCDRKGCTAAWHLKCCDPPLDTIPRGDWFCPLHAKTTKAGGKPMQKQPKSQKQPKPSA